ncbi:MAG: helix-turn-helix domain-containing protein [Aggregatilineales bacterium]
MPFRINLKKSLRNLDMTSKEIARQSGVHENTVSKYLNGEFDSVDSLPHTVNKLAAFCGHNPNILNEEWAVFYDDTESPGEQNTTPDIAA